MAARQQQKKDLTATIQYEDFFARYEWKEEPEATLLLLYLPGFSKEEIRVAYIHSSRALRVTGQRPQTADAELWSRFNQTFSVPQNCVEEKIQGSFKDGLLTITMPKQNITNPPPTLDNVIPEEGFGKEREEKKKKKLFEEEESKQKTTREPEERKLPEISSYQKPEFGTEFGLGKKNKEKGMIEKIIRKKEMTNEDRKLLTNMGVAAVVIFALGACISYTLSSSSSSGSSSSSSSSSSKPE